MQRNQSGWSLSGGVPECQEESCPDRNSGEVEILRHKSEDRLGHVYEEFIWGQGKDYLICKYLKDILQNTCGAGEKSHNSWRLDRVLKNELDRLGREIKHHTNSV